MIVGTPYASCLYRGLHSFLISASLSYYRIRTRSLAFCTTSATPEPSTGSPSTLQQKELSLEAKTPIPTPGYPQNTSTRRLRDGFGAQEILLLTAEVRRALTRCVCIVVVVVVIQALIARQVELQSRTKRPQSHRSRLVALGSRV